MNTAATLRQKVHELADQLPDTATWNDVIEEARFRLAVEDGMPRPTAANLSLTRTCAMLSLAGA